MAVMRDSGGVSWEDLVTYFPWTLPGDRHSGAHTATFPQGFLYQDNQGGYFRPLPSGGWGVMLSGLNLWAFGEFCPQWCILLYSPFSCLSQISSGHQVSKVWAAGQGPTLPYTRDLFSDSCFSLKFRFLVFSIS